MKKQTALLIAALVVSIPAWVLLLNLVIFAFTGEGFLDKGDGDINAARGMIAWFSAMLTVAIVGMATGV